MKIRDLLLVAFGAEDKNCPSEVDVLSYSESKLSTRDRARVERHFAGCDDCRRLLTFLAEESIEKAPELSRTEVSEQTNRVLGYIRNDEINRTRPAQKDRSEIGFHISYPKLATIGLVVCAIFAAAAFLLTRGQAPAEAGMEALRLAVKDQRRTEARLSGGFDYSPYASVTRGDDARDDNLHFDRALGKLTSAEQGNAPAADRLVLARAYIARGTRSDIDTAIKILNQLSANGGDTSQVLNDIGVAQSQRGSYDLAIESFAKALAKTPHYDEALFNKALAEQRAHHTDDAKRDWQQYIDQATNDKWKSEAVDYLKTLNAGR